MRYPTLRGSRPGSVALIGAGLAVALSACTAGGGGSAAPPVVIDPSASHAPVTISVWGAFTGREAKIVQTSLDRLHTQIPWLTATYSPGKSDGDIAKAIAAGQPPDIAMAQGPDNVAKYCDTGAWVDLSPYITATGLDMATTFPPSALSYTAFNGIQCSLPLLTDAYGLYYNKAMLAAAGYSSPPKTLSELTAMAKKMTVRSTDGTIQRAGFVSTLNQMYETTNIYNGVTWGAKWYDAQGKSVVASDPKWSQMLQWDKSLTDWYGYDNLKRFFAPYRSHEWDAGNAFEQGKVAMLMDGEWRGAFVKADNSSVDYGTAPFPVPDDQAANYGVGQIGGTIAGIPKSAPNPGEAWLVLKFLTTDTQSLNTLADDLLNVPTTFDSLKQTDLKQDPKFDTFIKIFQDPSSSYKQLTPTGQADVDLMSTFISDYEQGKVSDLQQGLLELAKKIDNLATLG